MATYNCIQAQLLDNVGVVRTLTNTPVEVGNSVTFSSLPAPFTALNATFTVTALPNYLFIGVDDQGDYLYDWNIPILNQIAVAVTATDADRQAVSAGTLTFTPTCSWVSVADVEDWLGFTVTNPSSDYDLLVMAVAAGNQFAWRRRQEAGYVDSLTTVPSGDVKLGTIMYCGYLYRMRGSASESYAAYDPLATSGPIGGSFVEVLRLLGINRPQVA
jgi:hypothetical protein